MEILSIFGDKPKLFKLTPNIKSYAKLSAIPLESKAIIVSQPKDNNWLEPLQSIRAQTAFQLIPVFYLGDIELDWQESLYDGPADESMYRMIEQIYERIDRLHYSYSGSLSAECLLLSYLFTRPNKRIHGLIEHITPQIFYYPLVEMLLSKEKIVDIWQFLQDLVVRDLLVTGQLIDEIQTCSSCNSGFLNIKHCCPSCQSIDIKDQQFVHCYLCGNIAPVPEFLREERLICTRCHARLINIGIDYDKPKQDKMCHACGHFFSQSELILTCLVCHRSAHANDLMTRHLYDYMITTRGQQVVCGLDRDLYRSFEQQFRVVDYQSFMSMVSWFSKLCQRYETIYFALLQIKLLNDFDLMDSESFTKHDKSMGLLFTHLREVIRKSDLSARDDNNFFFLLPMADEQGLENTIKRVKKFISKNEVNHQKGTLNFTLSSFTSKEILSNMLDADMIIAEIQAKMAQNTINLSITS
ncbi:hypothetical protein [Legionella sp. W05-934-2]|jgi:hypothetical protein|uniref:TackOD1 domain-containing metal-binding protein n=1 Tax=Legionella sp. W05-934-2 TaxID=1198649 RepID=UPI0034637C20